MSDLQHITTEYIDSEDRLRLSGELASGQTIVLWLTQRILNRLVTPLHQWLKRKNLVDGRGNLQIQDFTQRAVWGQPVPETPVNASLAQENWRVEQIDIALGDNAVRLTFKGQQVEQHATLILSVQALYQWLVIVYGQFGRGGWSTGIWPEEWPILNAMKPSIQNPPVIH